MFFHHGKDKRRGANTQEERGKKDAGLRLKQLLSLALCVVHMRSRKKKKKLIAPTDGYPIQRKCQKDSHDSQSTCEKEHSAQGTRWVYRWLYVQGDDGEPITNVSVSSYFQGQNHLCVLKQLRMLHSHLFRTFIFAVMKYRRIQNEHFCLFEIKSFFRLLKTLAGEQIKRFGQMKRVLPFTALRLLLPPSDYFTFCSLGDDLNDKSSAEL